ncbi:MAG: UDP-glucose 6-dehydrogenase [Gammaproteobacteria bacterium]|nr:UDP-glucose 6-dehydrogenase [Gammaproteobacteria bacterium]
MKSTIYGAGYVGLVTGVCLADVGNDVLIVDIDQGKIECLNQGKVPIYEPGLEDLVLKNTQAGRLAFTSDPALGVSHGLFQFIAVGTPPDQNGAADLQYVFKVAKTIGHYMNEYRIIIDKSTVPVGTGTQVKSIIEDALRDRQQNISFSVVSNPEFLKEGAAIKDFMNPDRIILGTDCQQAVAQLQKLYEPFNANPNRLMIMDLLSAELTKYAANAMLATKISFMNELSHIAERVGADIEQVRLGIGADPRIGYHFIYPGCGYGGSCFPKDVSALRKTAEQYGYSPLLLTAVEEVNHTQKQCLFSKIDHYFKGNLKNKTIAVWGLAFKPNTDDMRDATSRVLMESLWKAGVKVQAYDPVAMKEAKRLYGEREDFLLCNSAKEALINADALAIVTEWREFQNVSLDLFQEHLKNRVIFDGRNIYDPRLMAKAGMTYFGIGRGESIKGML